MEIFKQPDGVVHDQDLYNSFKKLRDQDLEKEQMEMLLMALMVEKDGKPGKHDEAILEQLTSQIILKRISAFSLPIQFNVPALVVALAMTKSVPGRVVIFLVDALNEFGPGTTVTAEMITDKLYPNGFYSSEVVTRYIDEVMKPRKVNWSYIY